MSGRVVGASAGLGCLLLGVALAFAALPPIGAGQEYRQTLGWLDLKLDGLSLYFALLGLATLGLALLAGRWGGIWQLLPLAATYLIVRSYALGEWSLALRLAAELGAVVVMLVGLGMVVRRTPSPSLPQRGRGLSPSPSLPQRGRGWLATMLIAWGMVGLAICSSEPSAVGGGLMLAAGAALLGVAISGTEAGRDKSRPYTSADAAVAPTAGNSRSLQTTLIQNSKLKTQYSPFYLLPSTFYLLQLPALWLYIHAALGRGELLYAVLVLVGAAGVTLGLLRMCPPVGWLGWLLGVIGVAGFAGSAALVDGLLRPALAGLAGLPAWAALRVQRLDLPAPQPDAAVGIGLQTGQNSSLMPLLAIACAFGFALALAWLLYRVIALFAAMRRER